MLELIVVVVSIAVFLIIFRLASNLRQTKQRVEHLSSKNKHLSNELEEERQHNVNLRRKLGVSESSLTEVRQHNEHLTSALTQASQRNEQLSNKLEQERQRNANLERKLEISGYSGYPALLDGIYSAKQLRTDIQKHSYLQNLRDSAAELWREYQSSDISPDYSREDYQEAYLLCYFLPYSQPVPYLLNQLVLKKNFSYQLPEDGLLTASFFGCGPGPELLGLMRYLAPFQPCINISAAMFDRESWEHGRKIVFRHLLDCAWNPDLYNIQEYKANLVGNARDFLPADSEEWVKRSDLIVIQHCLNERHNAKSALLIENMKQLVKKMKTGAVMLIIERATYVRQLLGKFRYVLQEEFSDSAYVSSSIDSVEKIKPVLEVIPKELATNFLTAQRSNSINSVEFIWVAIGKK
jgi:uncharacterized membrane-anchored protein YhcB (DUF1043 family)